MTKPVRKKRYGYTLYFREDIYNRIQEIMKERDIYLSHWLEEKIKEEIEIEDQKNK